MPPPIEAIRKEIVELKKELGLENKTDLFIYTTFFKIERKDAPLPPFQVLMNRLLDLLKKDKCVGCEHYVRSCLHCEYN